MTAPIPVVLFTYTRRPHLRRVLACLRDNSVPLLYAYSDGAKDERDAPAVAEVRAILREIDWCEVRLVERSWNLGLGRSILSGVTEVAARHDSFIVWEDDLICVSGTYAWLCAALWQYADDLRVMSISAWTHPRVTPADIDGKPYFDARAECWVWGAYARAWRGMEQTALEKIKACAERGLPPDAYGADLPLMACEEEKKNIWAVRWLYHHLQHSGVCLRPPWSMVEHIGFDVTATNAAQATSWANPPLLTAPPLPDIWPDSREHPACRPLWRAANPGGLRRFRHRIRKNGVEINAAVKTWIRGIVPTAVRSWWRQSFGWKWFEGEYRTWADAREASTGYDDEAVLARVLAATREVKAGRAAWERDGVVFTKPALHAPFLAALRAVAFAEGGRLDLIDFGGSLGSTWWQYRTALADLPSIRWRVVEQPHFVAAGRQEFTDDVLDFHVSLDEALAGSPPVAILLSSVLPYVERPHELLAGITRRGFRHIIIDRTPFVAGERDHLVVQRTPPALGGGSYPCWLFVRGSLLAPLQRYYRLTAEWPGLDDIAPDVVFRGFFFERTTP